MTNNTQASPLAKKLQELIDAGLVVPAPIPAPIDFPSARIVVPVYDSNGTGHPLQMGLGGDADGRLARYPR